MSWLRLDDGFPEHEKILGLQSVGAKWLHVVALCQCAKNLTDGKIDPARLAIICATAAVPKPTVCVQQLVASGLWIELPKGGYRIKDYLLYNPDAKTVKSRREARQKAGKEGAESRWRGKTDGNSDGKSHTSSYDNGNGVTASESHMPPDPDPYPSEKNRPVEEINRGNLETLSYGHALRLFAEIRDTHKDDGTRAVILSYASKLPPAAFERIREQLESTRHSIKHEGKWVNAALKKLVAERSAA